MEKVKQNIPLMVGLSLPLIMVVLITLAIYLPRLLSSVVPSYDFLYMANDNYSGCTSYEVKAGHVVKYENDTDYCKNWKVAGEEKPLPPMAQPGTTPPVAGESRPAVSSERKDSARFFIHDVTKNVSREVSYEEAQQLMLNTGALSPDGFEIKPNYGNGGIFTELFGGGYRNYDERFIVGHSKSTKLNLWKTAENGGYYNFQFLGWITPA